MNELFVISLFKVLEDTILIYSACKTSRMNLKVNFRNFTRHMHLQLFTPLFEVYTAIPFIDFRKFLIDISIFLSLIINNNNMLKPRNAYEFSYYILDAFRIT